VKKTIALILSLLLAAALSLSGCSKPESPVGAETDEQSGITLDGLLPSEGAAAEGPSVDLASLSDETLNEWADTDPMDFGSVDLSAYITLGQYSGLAVTKESAELTEEEFQNELDALLDDYSYYEEITDRKVEEGDRVRADYAGYKDGEAFAGGTAYDQEITAKGGTGYIDGFAEAFIGQTPGEEFSFNVTFPEDYGYEELNGKEVTFVATVHGILSDRLIVPELTDEFVSSNFGYDSADLFREAYRLSVERQKADYVESAVRDDLWTEILRGAVVKAYPESEVNRIYAQQRLVYESYAGYYQTDYETFLSAYLNTSDEEIYTEAQNYTKEKMVLNALCKELQLSPSDADYDREIEKLAEYNGMTVDEMVSYYGEDLLRESALWQIVLEAIAGTAVISEG
jgi:trigger factor